MSDSNQALDHLRLLVVIASYGQKNLGYLEELIRLYRGLPWQCDIVLVTEAKKPLADNVEQVVGLPSTHPHSLPFAHKKVFAERADAYDLFIYTEDDIRISEESFRAFLAVTARLGPDEVAGFIRYELDAQNRRSMPDVHWEYHWDPQSVAQRGPYTIAEFTNLHTGFYVLTRAHLRRALESGRFVCEPYRGPYGMLESAATDPFTRCGLKKIVCISEMESFLVHHMSNRYVGKLGISYDSWKQQIETLVRIRDGAHPASSLCRTASRILPSRFSKSYYEEPSAEVLELIPKSTRTLLSVGCGWGETELQLTSRGLKVTALPLDSVIGALAASRGVSVRYGVLNEALEAFANGSFDCILISNLLHLLADPARTLAQLKRLLSPGGSLIVSGPNFESGPVRLKTVLRQGEYAQLNTVESSGVIQIGMRWAKQVLKGQGLRPVNAKWFDWTSERSLPDWVRQLPTGLLSRHWVVAATWATTE